MSRGNTWTNSDGLVVGFGKHSVDNDVPAVLASNGGAEHTVTCEITLAGLPDTFAATNRKPQEVVIPRGSVITSAYVVVKTAAAGPGTLDIGLWGTNDSVDDADGIVADITQAEMDTAGEVHVCDGSLVLDSGGTAAAGVNTVGATANSDVVIAPSYETSAFTDGVILLTVTYLPPSGSTDGSIAN